MATDLLPVNVTATVITPYLELKLLPKGAPDWDLVTNNNWIKVENAFLNLEELFLVTEQSVNSFSDRITGVMSAVENEAILRSQEDELRALRVRFSHRTLTTGAATAFTHSLGNFPQVSVIKEVTPTSGVDVTNAFDTLVTHPDVNQISVTIGVSGTYTIICIA